MKERLKRGQSQEAAGEEVDAGQGRFQRWEKLLFDVEPDRELHERLRAYLRIDRQTYAEAALEHAIKVKERRK